jgi:serine-type D-Ala-D-Ala carboxypeptidase (penicillin-binding protein 5/6)
LKPGAWLAPVVAAALAGAAGAQTPAVDPFPKAAASYLVQVQGKTVWSHRADRALAPASLTKIMTALLVLESGKPLDDVVTVGAGAQKETGTRLGLRAGEKMRAGDLLAAALLQSANDACLALAEHAAGSKAAFVARMNARARELGMARTHFTNPCGHDGAQHRSSARDVAVLTEAALAQPFFAEIVTLVSFRVTTLGGRAFELENKNELIGRYDGAVGVKSGYTPGAGKCLVALARRGGTTVLLVMLDAPNRWWDAVAMLDRAFAEAR